MKNKKIILILTIVIAAAVIYFAVSKIKLLMDIKTYQEQVEAIIISNIDVSLIPDGDYIGSHEVIWVAAKVKVTVKDKRITNIELLKHKNGRGKTAEIIPRKIVETQSLKVDTISGATSSSKVILKAVENALNSWKR